MDISLVAAFLAGVASLLSPCVLPLLPSYLAFLGANSEAGPGAAGGRWRLAGNMALFFCGFIAVFVLMGASASYIGRLFADHQSVVRQVGGGFMVLMGLQVAGVFSLPLLRQERRPLLEHIFHGPAGAFLFGVAVAAGWTPCIGPILATILMYAGTAETVTQGVLLLLVYALGFCLPFLLLAFLYVRVAARFTRLFSWLPWIQRIAGIIIILTGIAIFGDYMNALQALLLNLAD
jgi:Cytochrome c biogenesis protein